mgnify:CR=1 FL=1
MGFDLVKYQGHPSVVKNKMHLFMLTERVIPSKVKSCPEQAWKAEKEARNTKGEMAKLEDLVVSMNKEFKTMLADIKRLKAKK